MQSHSDGNDEDDDEEGKKTGNKRRRLAGSSSIVLPKICIICKNEKKRITQKGKRVYEQLSLTRSKTAGSFFTHYGLIQTFHPIFLTSRQCWQTRCLNLLLNTQNWKSTIAKPKQYAVQRN